MSVAIRKGKNIKDNLNKIFDDLNFQTGERVFIKPNLCGRKPILPGENTSIEVAIALIKVLQSRQENIKIIIGHGGLLGSFDHSFDFNDVMKSSGFFRIA